MTVRNPLYRRANGWSAPLPAPRALGVTLRVLDVEGNRAGPTTPQDAVLSALFDAMPPEQQQTVLQSLGWERVV